MNFPNFLYQSKHFFACEYGIPLHLSIYAGKKHQHQTKMISNKIKKMEKEKKEKDHHHQQTRIPPPQTEYRQWHKQSKKRKKKITHNPQKFPKNFQILKKKKVCIHVRPTPGAPKPKGIETSS